MSFLIYQRSDPRHSDPECSNLRTQQYRLRNLVQIIGINLGVIDGEVYFTLHASPMSAPFFTSEKASAAAIVSWRELEPRKIVERARLSAPAVVVRVWIGDVVVTAWTVYFSSLLYLGSRGEWTKLNLLPKTLLFRMANGVFTSGESIEVPRSPSRPLSATVPAQSVRASYSARTLLAFHRVQRSLLEEKDFGRDRRMQIGLYGYSTDIFPGGANIGLSGRALQRLTNGKTRLLLKGEIEALKEKVALLRAEKVRAEVHLTNLRRSLGDDDGWNNLRLRTEGLRKDKDHLRELWAAVAEKAQQKTQLSAQLSLRRKQLISELLLIYPICLVDRSKRFSINEVQLPNAEEYSGEGGGQISVSLGYTAHMVALLAFLLAIPLRYPIRHFGSRSRIVDHITIQMPDKEREFPLYFKGREDVYSRYAVYLLNKNIAQIRWYCGLSSPDLRQTLPNLYNLLTSRLIIPGWPPSPSELEVAQEITEEIDRQLYRNDISLSLSLDQGLDQIGPISRSIDNMWLRSSFSDLEYAGGNVVPEGEIRHGRAQERFLSGWKKKTYESEDVDPRWLTNSLDFDINSSPRKNSIIGGSFIMSNSEDQSEGNSSTRRRRSGHVEVPDPRDIAELEKTIHEFERRKSVSQTEPIPTASDSPNGSLGPPTSDENHLEDAVADVVRKMSLAEMRLNRSYTKEEFLSLGFKDNSLDKTESNDFQIEPSIPQEFSSKVSETSSVKLEEIVEEDFTHLSIQPNEIIEENGGEMVESLMNHLNHSTEVSQDDQRNPEGEISQEESETKESSCSNDSLWGENLLRNEALLTPKSFNLLKRRVSDSNT